MLQEQNAQPLQFPPERIRRDYVQLPFRIAWLARIHPWDRAVPDARQMFQNPLFRANLEKAATRFESWISAQAPGHVEAMCQFMNARQCARGPR
jgi:hypothetical protein